MAKLTSPCPCGSGKEYSACCARWLEDGEIPPSAEALMRSRYCAYTLGREDYLLATWHASTRPGALNLHREKSTQWLGLEVKRHGQTGDTGAEVEFVARYKVQGRACRMHEVSRFVREQGRWYYVDGDVSS